MTNEQYDQIMQAIKELHNQMQDGFAKIDKRFEEVDKRFDAMDEKVNKLQDSMDLLA